MAEKKPVSIYNDDDHRITHLMAWVAMFVSIISLALVADFYFDQRRLENDADKTSKAVNETAQIQQEQEDMIADLTTDFKLVDMRSRINEIRDDIGAEVPAETVQQNIGELRTSFRTFYAATEALSQTAYQNIDQQLTQLASEVGGNSDNIQNTISNLLTTLQESIDSQTN